MAVIYITLVNNIVENISITKVGTTNIGNADIPLGADEICQYDTLLYYLTSFRHSLTLMHLYLKPEKGLYESAQPSIIGPFHLHQLAKNTDRISSRLTYEGLICFKSATPRLPASMAISCFSS